MRIIDARSGRDVEVGDTISYDQQNWIRLLDVRDRLISAQAYIEGSFDGQYTPPQWGPLTVRFTHPGFMFQRVAFIPT